MPEPGANLEQLPDTPHAAAIRAALLTYLPRAIIRPTLDDQLVAPWLRRADVSLLFADLSGSTALAERLSARGREGIELVTGFLNDIFALMIDIIEAHGGDLLTFGGDALLVAFDDADHPATAAHAALALQTALHGYERAVAGLGSFPMHLHIGVERGVVAFAAAGPAHALHYCVLGDTVGRVAAAEGRAGPEEVVIGPQLVVALGVRAAGVLLENGFMRLSTLVGEPIVPLRASAPPPTADIAHDIRALSPFVSAPLLAQIALDPASPQLEADLRPVTVLFAQIAGVEALATRADDTAVALLQQVVTAIEIAIARFGGLINKLDVADEGLKLLAIFGAPTAYEDHAERAARAALALLASAADLSAAGMRLRIGINLGVVFAGNVGSTTRKEYTVMGDAVNVAARVMARAAWGEIWLGAAAIPALSARMICEPRGPMALRGIAVPLQLYALRGERTERTVIVAPPLIGRAAATTSLAERLAATIAGVGGTLRLVGEAGVGKSRLAEDLAAAARVAGAAVIVAPCYSYTASTPYAAWGEWLRAHCAIVAGDTAVVRAAKLNERLHALGLRDAAWAPLLGDLVRADLPENQVTRGLDAQQRQERTFDLIERLLVRAAATAPQLVIFEDLHHADALTIALFARLGERLAMVPCLLFGVHRPATQLADLGAAQQLGPLDASESARLVAQLGAGLAPLVVQQISARAGGNPLFLAELIDAVHERGAAVLETLPDSLSGLLLARIDRIDPAARTTLRVAAVVGQRVPCDVLDAVADTDPQTLRARLDALNREELTLIDRLHPERVDLFRQALLHEVAYHSMLYARRRELHGRIGAYLERRYADRLEDFYGLLAHHYALSDQGEQAIGYLLKAGHAARDAYANQEAEQLYLRALALLGDRMNDPRGWEAHDALGDVLTTVGRYDAALMHHDAVIAAPDVLPDAVRRAYRKRGSVLEKQGSYDAALESLTTALELARAGGAPMSPIAIPLACADIALVHKRRGAYDAAIAACEDGLRHMRSDPRTRADELIEARLNQELGGIYGRRGDYTRARQHFVRCLALQTMVDDLPGLAASENNLGFLDILEGRPAAALAHYRAAEDIARRIDLRHVLVYTAVNTADALYATGDLRAAEVRCREGLDLSQALDARQTTAHLQMTLGIVLHSRGDDGATRSAFDTAIRINQELGSRYDVANTQVNSASALVDLGELDAARTVAIAALRAAEALDAAPLRADALNVLAAAALAAGDDDSAVVLANEALAAARAAASRHAEGIAQRTLGLVAIRQGEAADTALAAAFAQFAAVGEQFEIARTHAMIGSTLVAMRNHDAAVPYLKQAREAFDMMGADGELRRLDAAIRNTGA